ncbi:MAG: hypothetical protein ACKPA9_15380, partial [Microcystis sp.]
FVGWVSGSVTHRGVGFHASTQPTFILYLIPPTYLTFIFEITISGFSRFCVQSRRIGIIFQKYSLQNLA